MTITLNVRVNGNYRATIVPQVEGQLPGEPIHVHGPSGDTQIYFQHGSVNTFTIIEESLNDVKAQEQAAADAVPPAQLKPEDNPDEHFDGHDGTEE